jgi:hypothetical protein
MLVFLSCTLFLTSRRCRIVMWMLDQASSATSKVPRTMSLGLISTDLSIILISRCLSLLGSFGILLAGDGSADVNND